MPFIHTITAKKVSKESEDALRRKFGEAIALIPGKSERWLMLALSDESRMAFRGVCDENAVMAEVSLFGQADEGSLDRLTKKLTSILCEELSVPSDHVYVKYTMTEHWGYDGENF